ncbi:MAG: hypothetical protein Ct9H90mP7_2220 [Candidatus Neomarinimicrobiota bacterium]|nr:MAG: hypothetical protein Ct9H90mP7_2220 [Candidatus Neomarinimicrobiota bacterium]
MIRRKIAIRCPLRAQLLLGAEVNFPFGFFPSTSVTQTSRKGLLLFDFKDGGTVFT